MAVREFICNICGTRQEADVTLFARETASCRNCRSTVRYRALIHHLSLALFQESLVLSDFQKIAIFEVSG